MHAVFATHDVLCSPTMATVAPVAPPGWATPYADSYMGTNFTFIANSTGCPAASVPCGLVDGLPVGLQIIGPPGDEATVLRVCHAIEAASPVSTTGSDRLRQRPPVTLWPWIVVRGMQKNVQLARADPHGELCTHGDEAQRRGDSLRGRGDAPPLRDQSVVEGVRGRGGAPQLGRDPRCARHWRSARTDARDGRPTRGTPRTHDPVPRRPRRTWVTCNPARRLRARPRRHRRHQFVKPRIVDRSPLRPLLPVPTEAIRRRRTRASRVPGPRRRRLKRGATSAGSVTCATERSAMAATATGSKSGVGTARAPRDPDARMPTQPAGPNADFESTNTRRVSDIEPLHAEQVGPRRADLRGSGIAEIGHTEPR